MIRALALALGSGLLIEQAPAPLDMLLMVLSMLSLFAALVITAHKLGGGKELL
ncbi:hypothetical protein [Deinococcus radiophilus]|uniref:hypothetical protein n=1 Tax=Deinococcus radiophilus TaxID=32062 RepID=UPI001472CEEC|nr:hypothetical protein [Deinococcus radiophilus]UFA49627.1 hypothetical protein LMT64_06895 [Deinococcus radiophilus]